jgi:hypothetical protein
MEDDPALIERNEMIKMLIQDSKHTQPKVYKEPRVIDPLREGKSYWTVLFTHGWPAPNTHRAFSFTYSAEKKRWSLWSVCYDNEPIYDELTGSR